jgi:hypothetical protein
MKFIRDSLLALIIISSVTVVWYLSFATAAGRMLWVSVIPVALAYECLRRWRNREGRPNTCHGCGYDLRGLPPGSSTSARCPECGVWSSLAGTPSVNN